MSCHIRLQIKQETIQRGRFYHYRLLTQTKLTGTWKSLLFTQTIEITPMSALICPNFVQQVTTYSTLLPLESLRIVTRRRYTTCVCNSERTLLSIATISRSWTIFMPRCSTRMSTMSTQRRKKTMFSKIWVTTLLKPVTTRRYTCNFTKR